MNSEDRFEQAFIQCLKDGVYPGPSNINERYRKDKQRVNKLNGQKTKQRLALMYTFGVPYQRGAILYTGSYSIEHKTGIPDWPYLTGFGDKIAEPGLRKHEIQDPDKSWKLRRK